MKIAHISDLHLRHHLPGTADVPARQSREVPDRLVQAVQAIVADQPDLLVISGDLLDYPLDALDDAERLQQGERDLRLIAEILQPMAAPISLVHGNHDHPALVRTVFGHLPMARTVAGHQVLCFYDDEDSDHHPRRLGPSHQRFLDALADPSSPPQIHVQHYIIWPQLHEDYPYNYREGTWLRDQIVDSGRVRLVLSGHYHKGIPLCQLGETYFATVPTFSEPPYPYWLYEIREDGITCIERQISL
jgi:predicted MPP superfamily phosphohydrolase